MTYQRSCGSCGSPVDRSAAYCPKCGAVQETEAAGAQDGRSGLSLWDALRRELDEATAGEFEIVRELGKGAMGMVFLANDLALTRRVAIKVVAPQLLADERMIERFRLEARTIASLRHPHIVTIYTVRSSGDLHYFVMDYIEGTSLRSIIKSEGPLPLPVVRALLHQVGGALDYAHDRGRGVIHRDVKPANIMVSAEGDAVVTDFGISKVAEGQGVTLTGTGLIIGTPEYMSPEQCTGGDVTSACDQYALGVVAYEMLTGRAPFSGTQMSVMVAHIQDEPDPIRDLRPDCPPDVASAVSRMLAKAPEDRWPSIDDAVAALGGFPLTKRHPVRSSIADLVGRVAHVGPDLHTHSPLSPVPGVEVDPEAPTIPSDPGLEPPGRPQAAEVVEAPSEPEPSAAAASDPTPSVVSPPPTTVDPESPRRQGNPLAVASMVGVAVVVVLGGSLWISNRGAPPDSQPPELGETRSAVPETTGGASSASNGQPEAAADRGGPGGTGATPGGPDREQPVPAPQEPATGPATSARADPELAAPPTVPGPVEIPADPNVAGPTDADLPASLVLTVPDAVMVEGERQPFSVRVLDLSGDVLTSPPGLTHRSRDSAVLAVDDGVIEALAPGTTYLVSSVDDAVDSVRVVVRARVASVEIVGGDLEMRPGAATDLSATVRGSDGRNLVDRVVTWRSETPAVASVDERTGRVTAVGEGRADVVASVEGVEGRITLTVSASEATAPARTVEEVCAFPAFWPHDAEPALENGPDLARELDRAYPLALRNSGIGGTALVNVCVRPDGRVETAALSEGTGNRRLDDIALSVAMAATYRPGRLGDQPVPVWILLPLAFQSD